MESAEPEDISAERTPILGTFKLRIDFGARWALRLSNSVVVAAGSAAVVAVAIILYTFVIGQLPDSALILLAPAVPILVTGQLWCIAILIDRRGERRSVAGGATRWFPSSLRIGDLRGGLSRPVGLLFLLLFYGAFLLGPGSLILANMARGQVGVPTDDPSSCEYTSNNHGLYTCLTKSEYERERIESQRAVAGVFLGFFIAHCGLAFGEVLHRRQLAATADRPYGNG
ncbi:MAG: hypothetical protein WBF71_09530 [Microthrixaceae bacterium]